MEKQQAGQHSPHLTSLLPHNTSAHGAAQPASSHSPSTGRGAVSHVTLINNGHWQLGHGSCKMCRIVGCRICWSWCWEVLLLLWCSPSLGSSLTWSVSLIANKKLHNKKPDLVYNHQGGIFLGVIRTDISVSSLFHWMFSILHKMFLLNENINLITKMQ